MVVIKMMMVLPQTVRQPRGEGELDVSTPTATGAESGGGGAVRPAVVLHGEPLTDRKSTFQAHAAQVNTTEQVSQQFLYVVLRIPYTEV